MEKFTFNDYVIMDKLVQRAIDEGNIEDLQTYMGLRSKIYLRINNPEERKNTDMYIIKQLAELGR